MLVFFFLLFLITRVRASPRRLPFGGRLYLEENGAQRFLGSDAVALSSMCPSCVIADPRGMLGVPLAAARDAQSSRVVGAFNHTLVPSDPPSRGKAVRRPCIPPHHAP